MVTEIKNLQKFITNTTGKLCTIGPDKTSQGDYLRIMPLDFLFGKMNKVTTDVNYPVAIQIIVDRYNTMSGYEILEKLVENINSFDYDSGGLLQEDGTAEYNENEFVITLVYNLKTILQKES
jgi:hypothetical protein